MRWVKHMTHSHTDEKLAELISDCGLEGYGFWWLLVEVIAFQMNGGEKCSASYTLPHWSRLLYSHHNRVGKYLGKLGVIGIVTVEYEGSKIRVTVPNLLKYRDEYSKKSGQSTESVRSKKQRQNTETEIKKEDIGDKSPPPRILSDLWNEIVKEPRVTVMNKSREGKSRLRLKERTPDEWRAVFTKIVDTPFLQGQNDRGWRADFDWIIANDTYAVRVLEGKYDNKPTQKGEMADDFKKRFLAGS